MVLIKVLSYQKRTFLFFTKKFNLLVKISRSWVYLRRDASFFFGILVKSVWFGLFCNVVSKFSMWGRLHPKVPRREPCVTLLYVTFYFNASQNSGKRRIVPAFSHYFSPVLGRVMVRGMNSHAREVLFWGSILGQGVIHLNAYKCITKGIHFWIIAKISMFECKMCLFDLVNLVGLSLTNLPFLSSLCVITYQQFLLQ